MQPEIAFVVDALPGMGGGERVLLAALELFPDVPIYTLVYNPRAFANTPIADHQIFTSFINRLPWACTQYRKYLPLMPLAVEQFDLKRFDLVVSFSYAVAHGVRIPPGHRHLSYTYTPMRYAWRNLQPGRGLSPSKWINHWVFNPFRKWDAATVTRVDRFAAISQDIAGWVRQVYHRDAQVIYPPVDVDRFCPRNPRSDYFITVSRLVAHKRIDLMVEAFSCLNLPLIVVGEGPEYSRLKQMASQNIEFTGFRPDSTVADLLSRARAYVSVSEEDFGIAVVEAQAAGSPVIAYGKGGVLETVIEGKTGLFFNEQSRDSLIDAVERFEKQANSFSVSELVSNARRFGKSRFKDEFASFLAV